MPQPTQPDGHPTKLEEAERIERTIELIVRSPKTTTVVKIIRDEFRVAESTAYDYLKKAREQMLEDSRADRQKLIAEGIALYRSVYADPKTRASDRLKAFEGLRKMLGLDAPTRQHIEVTALDKYSEAELKELAEKVGLKDDGESPKVEVRHGE